MHIFFKVFFCTQALSNFKLYLVGEIYYTVKIKDIL
jgi:hypothetical protein